MWGRMASGGRLVIGLCEFSSHFVARSAMPTGKIAHERSKPSVGRSPAMGELR